MPEPLVSVVIATYDRPQVLAFAIRSVLAQTIADWELIVVGDACGEETGKVVARLGDRRIRYHNLPVNFGEQSSPNNVGIGLSRGRYVALLNHDDLWFPDHLATAVGELQRTHADLLFAPVAWIGPADAAALASETWTVDRVVRHRRGLYDPATTMAPASSWVFDRGLGKRVGPWRPASGLYAESSQDFLFRAWWKGCRLACGPETTVLMFSSVWRERAYLSGSDLEQAYFWRRLAEDSDALRRDIAARTVPAKRRSRMGRAVKQLEETAWRGIATLGFSPREMRARVKRGRGDQIRGMRRKRGLDPSPL